MCLTEFSSLTRLRSKCTRPALNKSSKVKAKRSLDGPLNQSKSQNVEYVLSMVMFSQMYLVAIMEPFLPMVRHLLAKRTQWR